MPKIIRIIAAIMAILMGLSAIGMIAMYISAESYDVVASSLYASAAELKTLISLPII